MDSAKNKKNKIKSKLNYIKVTPHKSIYIYIYIYIGKKEIRSKMCNRIKKSAKQ